MKNLTLFFSCLLTTFTVFAQSGADQEKQIAWVSTQVEKKDIPLEILSLDPRTQTLAPSHKYEITIGIVDDNKWVTDTTGDDRGYTYGHFVKASYITAKGLRLTVHYTGDLYTQDTGRYYKNGEGSLVGHQKTMEESITKFVVDNAEQGRLLYYRAGVGWHVLEGSGKGTAAQVQQKFHSLVKEIRQPVNEYSNYRESAPMAEAAIGVQKNYQVSSQIQLEQKAEVGVVATGVKDASHVMTNAEASAIYRPSFASNYATKLTAGVTVKAYDVGTEVTPYVEASVLIKKKASCGVRLARPQGDAINYQKYNLPNQRTGKTDDIWTASCQYKF
ncbi:hypothetical protein [Pseudobdellovibrio sp. HCB154]|uniref:hypothetical protein n=1 Tax=Pseudobdellovibrio sp. HCB154 TaxID=3386277 RepID=UPI003916D576